jgi:ribose transport system permease protein
VIPLQPQPGVSPPTSFAPDAPTSLVRALVRRNPLGVALALAAILASFFVPELLSLDNLTQVLRQVSVTGIMAVGVTFVVVAGRLDLSVGSLLSLCVVIGLSLHDRFGPGASVAVILAIGLVVGCVNGLLVALLGLNSLIVTLGMLSLLQGVTYVLANGKSPLVVSPESTWFAVFGRGYVLGIPVPVLILVGLVVLATVVLKTTVFGRRLYAVGGNEVASRFSGINVRATVFVCYVLSGVLTSIGALVLASRVMAGQNNTGAGYEITVLSGVILGGASLLGGSGTVIGSVLGLVVLGFMSTALVLVGMPYHFQWLLTWVVVVVAMWIETASRRGRLFA